MYSDLLRSIHRDLDSGVNTFVVTSKNVNRLLCKQSLENGNINHLFQYQY